MDMDKILAVLVKVGWGIGVWLAVGFLGKFLLEAADLIKHRRGESCGFWVRGEPPLHRHLLMTCLGLGALILGAVGFLRESGSVHLLFGKPKPKKKK